MNFEKGIKRLPAALFADAEFAEGITAFRKLLEEEKFGKTQDLDVMKFKYVRWLNTILTEVYGYSFNDLCE